MITKALLALSLVTSVLTFSVPKRQSSVWNVANFKSLITFGDSYTDENRLSYILGNNGTLPAPGTYFPEGLNTASGGRTWPRFTVQYTGTTTNGIWIPQVDLYDYAVSGAVCSNNITPRLWIGTNDLGVGLFLTDAQIRGYTLTDYVECNFRVFDQLYASGGRYFVLFNDAPLQLAPLYANDTLNGTGSNQYWNPKPENHTAIAEKMHEYTTSVNTMFRYQAPYEMLIAGRYPDAHFAVFDVWQLLSDIYDNPTSYLNGSHPANVTGYEKHCNVNGTACTLMYDGTSSDSFMWFDELHPSEQTDRIIARTFVDVLNGNSSYANYY
ncbi:hypothetical protein LTR05_001396 [Lithohypha guttulata]|uniref:Carbohydrate esterase family 16 protein n=1 Tax=Lithohypha guttulata TaxID=1690604 RepID=A0AAN7YAH8_9EURO|nr:hypothetical protein LTR05_001396 [Lithohypha guttulata]